MAQGDVGYQVSIAGRHRSLLHEWGTRVVPGVEPRRFGQSIAQFIQMLQRRPNEWGDPVRVLRHAGLTIRRGLHDGFVVEYGVDDARRIVYVRDIRLAPWHPLYRDES